MTGDSLNTLAGRGRVFRVPELLACRARSPSLQDDGWQSGAMLVHSDSAATAGSCRDRQHTDDGSVSRTADR